jgi:chorismate mutase / prephenate dehydratase
MEINERIALLRQKIDSLDGQILQLLNERASVALEVGKIKSGSPMAPYNPQREEEILRRLESSNPGLFPRGAISRVFREVISACRSLETELAIVYFGPPATYTHLACIEHFGSSVQTIPKESIQEVFEAVEREKANFGMVPIENSTEGVVNRTLDMFIDSEVKICGEILIRISHDLLSVSGRAEDVQKIYSHYQALAQCRQWLRKNFPHAQLAETVSTAKAAQMAAQDPQAAAVASPLAAELYGLKVIESRIEDYRNNYTRFLVLGPQGSERTGRDKTSLLFSISDSPGALYEILKPFSEKSINLTKIESRPIKDKPWEYVFFLDFEGHTADLHIQEAVSELKKKVLFLKQLGSYPRSL